MTISAASGETSARHRLHKAILLACTVGACSLASSAHSAIVVLDLTKVGSPTQYNITGLNGGNPDGTDVYNFVGGTKLEIQNDASNMGADGDEGLAFAYLGGDASPKKFSAGSLIGPSSSFTGSDDSTQFKDGSDEAPDFGPNSFLGFRADMGGGNYVYGWLEATWNSSTDEFRYLRAAYQSTPNTAIAAGDVPEPGSLALVSLTLGGLAFGQWRRRRAETTTPSNGASGPVLAA